MNRRTAVCLRMTVLAALALAASSCSWLDSLLGVGISQRIQYFQDELNSADRSLTYRQFHPTLTDDYDAIAAASFWDIPFPVPLASEPDYLITVTTADPLASPTDVRATVAGPGVFGGPKSVKLVMAKDGSDWMIRELYFLNADGVTWDLVVS